MYLKLYKKKTSLIYILNLLLIQLYKKLIFLLKNNYILQNYYKNTYIYNNLSFLIIYNRFNKIKYRKN